MIDSEPGRADDPVDTCRTMDLNADLGEGFPNDEALLRKISSASICCGFHAGGPEAIRRTLRAARERGVVVGAHPGYPDREGFGRRPRVVAADEVRDLIRDQVERLAELAAELGCRVQFLKPHGALYNQAQRERPAAEGVLEAALALGLPLLGQPGTILAELARERGVVYIPEGFPDRRLRADGSLVPRSEPGAVLHDPEEIENQVTNLIKKGLVRTLCLHGDEPEAVRNADLVCSVLSRNGIALCCFLD